MLSADGVLIQDFLYWTVSLHIIFPLKRVCKGACSSDWRLKCIKPVLVSLCAVRYTSTYNRALTRLSRLSALLLILKYLSRPAAHIWSMLNSSNFLLFLHLNSLISLWSSIFNKTSLILKKLLESPPLNRLIFLSCIYIWCKLASLEFFHFFCFSHRP